MQTFIVEYLNRRSASPIEHIRIEAESLAHAETLARGEYVSACKASAGTDIRGFRILDEEMHIVRHFKPKAFKTLAAKH